MDRYAELFRQAASYVGPCGEDELVAKLEAAAVELESADAVTVTTHDHRRHGNETVSERRTFSPEDWEKIDAMPVGAKLYTTPPAARVPEEKK